MTEIKAYVADKIFTGDDWLQQYAVIVNNNNIVDLLPRKDLPADIQEKYFADSLLAPAFIDLQIYGAYEKLFSVYPNVEALQLLNKFCNLSGTSYCMPTVATNTQEVFYKCIDAIREYWEMGGKGILGLHAEGPWINKEKKGAHIESLIHSPSLFEAKEFLEYGKGVIKIITLAPEVCSREVIELIHSYGIKIFAGHSNATYEQAINSFNNKITAVTHLYNAMSALQHRNPGLVGAAFNHPNIYASIIADGFHVDFSAIQIAKKNMQQRLFAITDAVTETSEGFYHHQLSHDKYIANNILSGSALTMYKSLQNLVNHVGVQIDEALRMCSLYPARVMQMDRQLGKIKPGYKAKMAVIPKDLSGNQLQLIS